MGRPGNTSECVNPKKSVVKGVKSSSGKIVKKKLANSTLPRGQSQSCHQCRQSIHSSKGVTEVKQGKARLKCSTCTRFWCEQCLMNRYGVVKDEADPASWSCPVCEKKCNCSLCRKKEGMLATGILTPLVKNSGFESVSEFLDKGTTDIAKVLQWKSPSELVEENPRKETLQSFKPRKQRKRKDSAKSGRSKENNSGDSDHSSNSSRFPKRRKLTHSQYSITVEDNLEVQSVLTVPSDRVSPDSHHICSTPPLNDCQTPETLHSPPTPSSHNDTEKFTVQTPRRRSGRQRKQSQFFVSEDFRKDSSESPSPNSQKTVKFKSPSSSFKPLAGVSSSSEDEVESDLLAKKVQVLEELRNVQFEVIKQKKAVYEQKIKNEKDKAHQEKLAQRKLFLEGKAKAKEARAEERRKVFEEKIRLRDELKLSRLRAREKMRLAQGVRRQAMKELKRVQREKERLRKQELLAELKEKGREEKRQKLAIATTLIAREKKEANVCLMDDSPESCLAAGVSTLSPLPPLTLHRVPPHLIPSVLFVAEFLTVFSQALNLKKKIGVIELCSALASGRGLSEVYLKLLMVLINDNSEISKKLKLSKKQRDLEQAARHYLSENNINGYVSCASPKPPSLEGSLSLLDHLCHEALGTSAITESLDNTKDFLEQMKREQRMKERETVKQIGDTLKSLCEGGGTLPEIEQRKEDFAKELKILKENFQKELAGYTGSLRNNSFGKDRFNRKYWRLASFPGVIVEADKSSVEGDDLLPWAAIDSPSLLDKFMSELHPTGVHEKPLHDVLQSLKTVIFNLD